MNQSEKRNLDGVEQNPRSRTSLAPFAERNPGGLMSEQTPDSGPWPSSWLRLLSIALTTACTVLLPSCNAGKSTEEIFLSNLRNKITATGATNINLDFGAIAKWDEVCFDRNGVVRIKLVRSKTTTQELHLEFQDVFIDEEYVAMSPSGRCFARNHQFHVERASINGRLVFTIRTNK